ncbi:hypothetical protein Halru_1888 [Halovivax ruber XH-70]|uniref:Uncharacterized protein n=1 Tax=Halovivax ruber (strain DSM 18193 / JCM 13892 / XH-70) TaxID=797302 RepID=L0IE37_HALRX|nr:hypothetical protein [Halovivax ruber]AGB16486.1 hypothetical protein Halru_1888 [Halovivax ruber XH-70]
MRIREWNDLLEDVSDESAAPADWRAIAGDRASGVGEDLYLAHPQVGVYLLKTYAKNPYEVGGYGAEVARSLDDELGSFLPSDDADGRFALQQPPDDEDHAETVTNRLQTVVETHRDAPTTPKDFFDDVMDALESPAFGPMEYDQFDRPEELDELAARFEEAESVLDAELDELIEADDVDRGFM